MKFHRFCVLAGLLLVVFFLLGGVIRVFGFAEEELGFRDTDGVYYPPSGDFPENRISTIHDDLTYALAIAAGFSITDSQTIRIWDQLVDSEVLPGAIVSYTYGNSGFYHEPDPDVLCPGKNHIKKIWPRGKFEEESSSVTSRFGPYSPFFHFPHLGGPDLQAIHDWGWGISDYLIGYEVYGWGRIVDLTVMQAAENNGCFITRTVEISMSVTAGSLEAFATYLHTLGDAYSHDDCLAALKVNTSPAPWGTHTVPEIGDTSIYACDYNPNKPKNNDAHGREFGSVYSDTQRTIEAARAIYAELTARSIVREGLNYPLPLTTSLIVSGAVTTLDGAIVHFVTHWDYENSPQDRRLYVDDLIGAIQSTPRLSINRVFLPLLFKHN